MKNFVLTPFKAVCLGALLGLGCVAVIGLTPGLNKYTGNFFGDGGGLSNVPTSGMGTVITNGVFQWQLDATFENTLKKEGVHGVLFTYDHIDGSGATALWRTTDSALHFPNPPVFDGFANVLFSAGPSGGLSSVANGTGYLHDDGSGNFVYQLIPLSDLSAGGTYPSGNGQQITNILMTDIVDPTNGVSSASAVDFLVPDATTNVSGAFGFTSLANFNPTNYNYAIRHVPNTSGSSQTMTVAASWKTDSLRTTSTTYTITNNTVWTFFFECQIGQFTNVHAIVSFP